MSDFIAACENIHKTYLLGVEGVAALRGVTINVIKGEFLIIFGTSGGGKTSLLNILGTIDLPTKGNLMLLSNRVSFRTPDSKLAELRCKNMGFVFQSFNLISTMTALENVCLPMIISGILSRAEIRERAASLLNKVNLGDRMNHYPTMLSGGEQQRVAIARALANNPALLLLDEPTGDLDTKNTHRILQILLTLNRTQGITMVMVTHDVYMKPYAHRVLYMRDGKVSHIEDINTFVREQSFRDLEKKVEKESISVGLHDVERDEKGNLKRLIYRNPIDYPTFQAQKIISCLSQNDELKEAVEALCVLNGNKSLPKKDNYIDSVSSLISADDAKYNSNSINKKNVKIEKYSSPTEGNKIFPSSYINSDYVRNATPMSKTGSSSTDFSTSSSQNEVQENDKDDSNSNNNTHVVNLYPDTGEKNIQN